MTMLDGHLKAIDTKTFLAYCGIGEPELGEARFYFYHSLSLGVGYVDSTEELLRIRKAKARSDGKGILKEIINAPDYKIMFLGSFEGTETTMYVRNSIEYFIANFFEAIGVISIVNEKGMKMTEN